MIDQGAGRIRVIFALLFTISCITLFFQFFPSIWWSVYSIVNIGNWSWHAIWIVNAGVVGGLVAYRAWSFRKYE